MIFQQRRHLLLPFFTLLHFAACYGQSAEPATESATPGPAKEIFKKEITPGKQIVITREPFALEQLTGIETTFINQNATVARIEVKLRAGDRPDVLLGSTIQSEYADPHSKGFTVADVFTSTDELVVACVISDTIHLWRISLNLPRLLPDGWTWVTSSVPYAVVIPFEPDKVNINMSPLDAGRNSQRWKLTLIDKRPHVPVTIQFEQAPDAWRFKPVK